MKPFLALVLVTALAACGGGSLGGGTQTDSYLGYTESGPINNFSSQAIQARQLDVINAARIERGAQPVALSAPLTASALTHARDISAQQRAWNTGSDKSTPQRRAERAGFYGIVTGENVSETYRGEIQVIQNWLAQPIAREVILDADATHVGIAYFMDPTGKVWWVQDFGAAGASPLQ